MWQDLELSDKARMMDMAVKSGLTDLQTIEAVYNKFAEGGHMYGPGGDKPISLGQMITAAKKWYSKDENKKRLAMKLGTVAKEGAGLTPIQIVKALTDKHHPEYDELEAYLYGPERMYDPYIGTSKGPLTDEKYQGIPQYKAELNPRDEYVISRDMRDMVINAAKTGTNMYLNADELFDPGKERFDAANHPVKFRYQNGKIVADAADLYDFDEDYVNRYSEKNNPIKRALLRAEIREMQKVGTPYIVRQEGIPVKFIGEYKPVDAWYDDIQAREFEDSWKKGETGKTYNWTGAISNFQERMNSKADGGEIHIKKKNRGKFTALKKRTGHSASWFKANGTPAQKKMATFALNARKWHHGEGGVLDNLMTKL